MDEKINISAIWPGWEIESFIGAGSFGNVYRVKRELRGHISHAAVKIIELPQNGSEIRDLQNSGMDVGSIQTYYQEMVDNLMNEIAIMESLKSADNIVTIEDYAIREKEGEIGWIIYIRMEFLKDLGQYLKDKKTLLPEEVLKLGKDICQALIYCDKVNIIHRDIKIDNVFINEFGSFKLGDFGISKQLEKTTSALSQKGTNMYMAPEVFRGEKYGKTVDFYSLGIMMYRLLNEGRFPFIPTDREIRFSDTQEAMKKRLSGVELSKPLHADLDLWRIIKKACSFEEINRYQTADEMLSDLRKYEENHHIEYNALESSMKDSVDIDSKKYKDDGTVLLFHDETNELEEKHENTLGKEEEINDDKENVYNNYDIKTSEEKEDKLGELETEKLIEAAPYLTQEESITDELEKKDKSSRELLELEHSYTSNIDEEGYINESDVNKISSGDDEQEIQEGGQHAEKYNEELSEVEGLFTINDKAKGLEQWSDNEKNEVLEEYIDDKKEIVENIPIEKSESNQVNESFETYDTSDPEADMESASDNKEKKSFVKIIVLILTVIVVGMIVLMLRSCLFLSDEDGETKDILTSSEEKTTPQNQSTPDQTVAPTEKTRSFEIIDFSGMTKDEVKSKLSLYEGSSLSIEYDEKYTDSDKNKEKVINQSIDPGHVFSETDVLKVVLTINKGIERVAVPNIEGKKLSDAKSALKKLGFKVNASNRVYSSSVKSGKVVSQSIKPNKKVKKGTTIDLTVSKGNAPQSSKPKNSGGSGGGGSSDYNGVPLI